MLFRSNIDLGGYSINQYMNSLCLKFPKKYRLLSNLSEIQYLSLMNNAVCVIGNSSSGVIEAPLLGVPSINFGNRQTGRVLSKSVLNIKDNCSKCSKTATRILTFNSLKNSRANSSWLPGT